MCGVRRHRSPLNTCRQVSGVKTWRVWAPAWSPLPLRDQTEGKGSPPPLATRCRTVTLKPGDLLYVPRGHSHVAAVLPPVADMRKDMRKASGAPSIHLTNTLHVQDFTWEALLRLLITTGATRAAYDKAPPAAAHATGGLLTAGLVAGLAAPLIRPGDGPAAVVVDRLRADYGGGGACSRR